MAWRVRRASTRPRPCCRHSLGAATVNVRAIAQGASERNISVVIDGKDATKALRAAHAGFYLSPHTLSIGIIGSVLGVIFGILLGLLNLVISAGFGCASLLNS